MEYVAIAVLVTVNAITLGLLIDQRNSLTNRTNRMIESVDRLRVKVKKLEDENNYLQS